jgi:hypothetical protein
MLVLADTSGCLTITAAPTADKLKELAAKALPSAIPGAPAPSRWTPKSARIKAHKSGIVAAASVVCTHQTSAMLQLILFCICALSWRAVTQQQLCSVSLHMNAEPLPTSTAHVNATGGALCDGQYNHSQVLDG